MKYVNDTKAAKAISAYIILKNGEFVGKAQVHHGESKTFVNLWIDGLSQGTFKLSTGDTMINCCLYGSASGYGYNKENSAFSHAFRAVTGNELDFDVTSYEFTSKIDSRGITALEDHGFTVLQAI